VRRRSFLAALSALAASGEAARLAHAAPLRYPDVLPGARLAFPRDYGAHPDYRIEWWYITGWLEARDEGPRGFQITFFRARAPEETANPSRFAVRQIIFAHAALGDPRLGRLLHEERAARAALGLAGAADGRTEAWLDDWRLEQTARGYRASIAAREFSLALDFDAASEVMLQGEAGVSRKGPRPREASYYYSQPQMPVHGEIVQAGARVQVSGKAWLDHEWSSSYLAPEAAGWDWTGINLADGGALMLFRMRARDGGAAGGVYYAGGTLRSADGRLRRFRPQEIRFEPLRSWRSPRTGVEYPVAMRVVAGELEWRLEPLMDDQELDARASTGTIYWEGAVRAFSNDAEAGRGYLELTGYWRAMKL
jgi:predicted secreted hydrolase